MSMRAISWLGSAPHSIHQTLSLTRAVLPSVVEQIHGHEQAAASVNRNSPVLGHIKRFEPRRGADGMRSLRALVLEHVGAPPAAVDGGSSEGSKMPSAPFHLGAAARHRPPERQGGITIEAQPLEAALVAQRVRTGARFTRIIRPCSEVFMPNQPGVTATNPAICLLT